MRPTLILTAAVMLAIGSTAIAAPTPTQVIEQRQAGYKAMGQAFKALRGQFTGGNPDVATVQKNAALIAATAPQIIGWFPKGTGPDAGKTAALPAIWERPADFNAAAATLATESAKLLALASAADMAGAGVQLKAVGGACGACHKDFRKKDD
jgi:cytochrome c556